MSDHPHVIHCLTGSIAATLAVKLSRLYEASGCTFEMVATSAATNFTEHRLKLLEDQNEWDSYASQATVLHIDLMKRADVLVIAPLTANTLAKLANGLADNLVTCIARAWPIGKPIVLAPAMNTHMWENPVTAEHLGRLRARYGGSLTIVEPQAKVLFCGDSGIGAMAQADHVVAAAIRPTPLTIIKRAQAILAAHLPPDGIGEQDCINQLLGLLDGPDTLALTHPPGKL